jgi:16S rRNA (cytosine967-C5)-methyltransferase
MSYAKSTAKDRAQAAIRVLVGVESGKKATELFHDQLKGLADADRLRVVEGVYSVLRCQARLDKAIDAIAPLLRDRDRARARWQAFVYLDGEGLIPDIEIRGVAWELIQGAWDGAVEGLSGAARLALEHSLPEWFVARILADEPDGEALVKSLSDSPPFTLRANRAKISREDLAAKLDKAGIGSRPTKHANDGLILDHRRDVYGLPSFQGGELEVQDEGSQLISELVAPPPGGVIVDTCAGAGGKTLAIGALLAGKGRIYALDVPSASRRLVELARRTRRADLSNVKPVTIEATGPFPDQIAALAGKVDRVLVDAPCSGTGVYRRNPEQRFALTETKVARLAEQQYAIVERAISLLKPKGRLIYSTCSLLRAENDAIVSAILSAHPELEVVHAKEILGKAKAEAIGDGTVLRLRPDRHGTDGFYAAVLRLAK